MEKFKAIGGMDITGKTLQKEKDTMTAKRKTTTQTALQEQSVLANDMATS